MFDVKPSIAVDVLLITILVPLFVGGFHVIVYEAKMIWNKRNDIEEVVDDIFVVEFVLPGTETK